MLPPAWSLAFVAIVFSCYIFVPLLLRFAAHARMATVSLVALILCVWLMWTGWLAHSGALVADVEAMPPLLARYVALPALLCVLLLAWVPASGPFIDRIPADWLVSFQAIRVPVELVLHGLFRAGVIHQRLTFEGWNFDIATGLLALLLGFRMHKGSVPGAVVWAFNLLGLILLAVIVAMVLLSVPTPLQRFTDPPSLRLPFHVPFVWLPGFVVPLALLAHLVSLRKLVREAPAS